MPDGILIVDKPAGWTSHDVVARARRLLRERRVGHTGTLDPFATGVLVLLLGRATRLAPFLAGAEKEYEAVIRFGYATDTGDLTGRPLVAARGADAEDGAARGAGEESDKNLRAVEVGSFNIADCSSLNEALIENALAGLRGEIEQVPPMYSAKKVKGQKLYELARRGEEVERAAVRVTVREFEMSRRRDGGGDGEPVEFLSHHADGKTCDLRARVVCSAGTYVRTLAESVGAALGVGAHLAELRRTRAGEFKIESAVTLDALRELAEAGSGEVKEVAVNTSAAESSPSSTVARILVSPDAALSWMRFVHLNADEARRVANGIAVRVGQDVASGWPDGAGVRMRDAFGNLVAVGVYVEAERSVRPRVVLAGGAK